MFTSSFTPVTLPSIESYCRAPYSYLAHRMDLVVNHTSDEVLRIA